MSYHDDCCKCKLENIQFQLQQQQQKQAQLQAQLQNQTQAQNDTDTISNVGNPVVNVNVSATADGDLKTLQNLVRPSAFRAQSNANRAVPANTSVKVPYLNEQFDLANEYNPATSTFIPNTDGVYSIIASVSFFPNVPTQYRVALEIRLNGNQVAAADNDFFGALANITNAVTVSSILQLQAGDTVEIFVLSNVAGTLLTQGLNVAASHFEAARFPSPTA